MPIVMKKVITLRGNYTDEQKQIILDLIDLFRGSISDSNPDKNILAGKVQTYSDNEVVFYINRAIKDLNTGVPKTNYTLYDFPDDDILVSGAVVFALISEGLLQLKNQVDFSDSGLSINLFNKTSGYQGWAGFLMQQYVTDKMQWKSTILPLSSGSGFVGVGSQFGYYGGGY